MANGEATAKFILPGLASLGGLAVGVVGMIGFLYGQFLTLHQYDEFKDVLKMQQLRNDDNFKRLSDDVVSNQKALAIVQGFLDAHKAGK